MQEQVLEQMLSSVPDMAESYSGSSIDVYTDGVSQMDCFHNGKSYPCGMCGSGMTDPITGRDAPGQFITSSTPLIGSHELQERVDALDLGNLHLNYDVTHVKRDTSLKILRDQHMKDL